MIIAGHDVHTFNVTVYPNIIVIAVMNTENSRDGVQVFEISERKNEFHLFSKMFRRFDNGFQYRVEDDDILFCGYGNTHYDNTIVNYLLSRRALLDESPMLICSNAFTMSGYIMNDLTDDFDWKSYKYMEFFHSMDMARLLFPKSKRMSYRELAMSAMCDHVGGALPDKENLTRHQMDVVVEECRRKSENLAIMLKLCKERINIRLDVSRKYGIKCLSLDDIKVGMEILRLKYQQRTGRIVDVKSAGSPCVEVVMKHNMLNNISYRRKELNALRDKIAGKTIKLGERFSMGCTLGSLEINIGLGGIHACCGTHVEHAGDDRIIEHMDVESFYPSLIAEYGFIPKHMDKSFSLDFKEMREQRIAAKHSFRRTDDAMLKMALNGSIGNMNEKHSWMYDPENVISFRINGELLMLMLIEDLYDAGCKIIQANNDGIIVSYKKDMIDKVKMIKSDWQSKTRMTLESKSFESIHQTGVNDYIAVLSGYSSNRDYRLIICKGAFSRFNEFASPIAPVIIQEAVVKRAVDGIPIDKTVRECKNIHKFMMIHRTQSPNIAVSDGKILPSANRVYMSVKNNIKIYDRKYLTKPTSVLDMTAANNIHELKMSNGLYRMPDDIDYRYYIEKARDLMSQLTTTQLSLYDLLD